MSEFTMQVRLRLKDKITENEKRIRDIQEQQLQVERNKQYIKQLNDFLESEGERPEILMNRPVVSAKRTGNRSKNMPLRQARWDGMSMNTITEKLLNDNIGKNYKPKEFASEVYEIKSDADLNMVIHNVRSTLQRGARTGLWTSPERGKFTANKQNKLV